MSIDLGMPGVGEVRLPARNGNCRECVFYSGEDAAQSVLDNPLREPVCSGDSADNAYSNCARAGGTLISGGCSNCSVVCGTRTDIVAWMASIGNTLTFDDIDLSVERTVRLPRFIPQVDGSNVDVFDQGLDWPAYSRFSLSSPAKTPMRRSN